MRWPEWLDRLVATIIAYVLMGLVGTGIMLVFIEPLLGIGMLVLTAAVAGLILGEDIQW